MNRLRRLPIVFAAGLLAFNPLAPLRAQNEEGNSKNAPRLVVEHPAPQPTPFAPFPTGHPLEQSVSVLSQRQMSADDRALLSRAESTISDRAGFADFAFDDSHWTYQQIVCPALPNHLFVRFTRRNSDRDVSMFSASVPRGGDGRVRIVPILRRSYSLFSPAPVNAQTIAVFNHIRREENAGQVSDWLGTAVCYASLAGADPESAVAPASLTGLSSHVPEPVLTVPVRGGAIIRFGDESATPKPMVWTLSFDQEGTLRHAEYRPAVVVREVVEHPKSVDERPLHPAMAHADLESLSANK